MTQSNIPAVPALVLLSVFLTGAAGAMINGVQPLLVGAYVSALHLPASQAGLLAALDMAGSTLGTALVSWRLYAWRRSRVAAGALVVVGAGNLLSIAMASVAMLAVTRLATGIGAGVAAGIMVATISAMPSPDKRFGLYSVIVLIIAAGTMGLGGFLLASFGVGPMFCALAALAVPPLLLSGRFPSVQVAPTAIGASREPVDGARAGKILVVLGTLLYYVSVGGMWAFMGELGRAHGVSSASVNDILTLSLLAGAAGALIAVLLRERLGRALPLGASLLITLCCLIYLLQPLSQLRFAIAACCFIFAWIAFFPYLMGLCSSFDPLGRLGALCLGVQNIGCAVGPALAGLLVQHAGYSELIGVALLGVVMAGTVLLLAIRACPSDRRATR